MNVHHRSEVALLAPIYAAQWECIRASRVLTMDETPTYLMIIHFPIDWRITGILLP